MWIGDTCQSFHLCFDFLKRRVLPFVEIFDAVVSELCFSHAFGFFFTNPWERNDTFIK